ncbi:hypothetical protein [Pontiella sp.]|uniref:hypothetical protein n=1 Tax=Pontiella sp. TaxID=2837462 RepID=UPI0035632FA7
MTALLFVFPGFEARGLAAGCIIGYWPALLFRNLFEFDVPMLFLIMPALSGATVFLGAWLIDNASGIARSRTLLFGAMLIAASWFSIDGIGYEGWQRTPAIQQAMNAPEIDYQPNYADYCKTIAIPRALAGGMIGLYAATGLCALAALVKLGRNRPLRTSIQPTPGDDHGSAPSRTTDHHEANRRPGRRQVLRIRLPLHRAHRRGD